MATRKKGASADRPMHFRTLIYSRDAGNPRIARITLNRPEKFNAINSAMPRELRQAVELANNDDGVHVIVVQGKGEVFCAGFDIAEFGEAGEDHPCKQEKYPWDSMVDYRYMRRTTDDIMSLWRSHKPTIAKVQKYAIAGGSDIALCCDLIVIEDTARMGYMPVRVWGCPTTAMWTYRIGAARAKRLMFTGDLIDGTTAEKWGLAVEAVPLAELDAAVDKLATRIAGVPISHLMMQKLVVNQAVEDPSLATSQTLANVLDGITRHNPEGMWFRRHAQINGFKQTVKWRDSGLPIPQGDEARALVDAMERQLGIGRHAGNGTAGVVAHTGSEGRKKSKSKLKDKSKAKAKAKATAKASARSESTQSKRS